MKLKEMAVVQMLPFKPEAKFNLKVRILMQVEFEAPTFITTEVTYSNELDMSG